MKHKKGLIMRYELSATVGLIGGFFVSLFGGWTESLTTLVVVMVIDYVTGLIVAGVFNNSPKVPGGKIESRAGVKGLFKKGAMLLFVLLAARLDIESHSNYIKDTVTIAFIVNEVISIIENAGRMGIPMPSVIKNAINITPVNKPEEATDKKEEEK